MQSYVVMQRHVPDGRWGRLVYEVVELETHRRVSVAEMSHEEAVVLCERLNRLPAAESPFWSVVWRVYDRPGLVRLLPRCVAPWLFGKMIGSKGTRTRL